MRSPISPLDNYQLKSTLLRNDEQLLCAFNEQLRCAFLVECPKDLTIASFLPPSIASSLASGLASRLASRLESGLTLRLASRELAIRELSSRVALEVAFRLNVTLASELNWTSDFTVAFKLASTLHLALDSTLDSVLDSALDSALDSVLDSILNSPNSVLDLPLDAAMNLIWSFSKKLSLDSKTASISDLMLESAIKPLLFHGLHSTLNSALRQTSGQTLLASSELDPRLSLELDPLLASTLARVNELDRLFLRAEKNGMLRDVIAGIVEDSIHPALCMMNKIRKFGLDLDMDGFVSGRDSLADQASCLESLIAILIDAVSASALEFAYNALVSAVVLSIVYQYLIGYVDRGGTKTYNSGSLEFRATYVSLLLFQGAYVWIKFRDVATRKVSRRSRTDKSGNVKFGKWEPKFKPPREKDVATGTSQEFQCLRLAGYDTKRDAEMVCQVGGFYYGKDERLVELEDGFRFNIPPMSEQERGLSGMQKWNWVSDKAKEVFTQDFRKAHDQWKKSRRITPEHVEIPTRQAVGNVNDLHRHTVLQSLSDVSDFQSTVLTGIEATRIGSGAADYDFQLPENPPTPGIKNRQEGSNAQLASTPDSVASGADAIVDNQQPLFHLPTTRSVRTDEILSFGGTLEADLASALHELGEGDGACQWSVVNGADHSTGPLTNLQTFDSIDFETLSFDITFPAASRSEATESK